MPYNTYGRYPSYPYRTSLERESVPKLCRKLLATLKQCEDRTYPHQSNCATQRAMLRVCLRTTILNKPKL